MVIKKIHLCNKKGITNLQQKLSEKNKRDFTHSSLIHQPSLFQYLRGLTTDQFDIILQCSLPYIHLIPYPDCVGGLSHRKIDSATEQMAVLTVCRYGLNQGVMGFMLGLSKATIKQIFINWVIFLATLFNEIDLFWQQSRLPFRRSAIVSQEGKLINFDIVNPLSKSNGGRERMSNFVF